MAEDPIATEEQAQEPAPEQPESPAPDAAQEPDGAGGTPEEAPSEEEAPPEERRSILLPVLYVLVALLILAEGFVAYAWWSAVSDAQKSEARRAAQAADRSDLSGTSYSNRYGTYRPNDWPEGSSVYAGGASGAGGSGGRGQVVDSQEPTELTEPVADIEPEGGD